MKQEVLRQIPKVDELLKESEILRLLSEHPRPVVIEAIRAELDHLRQQIFKEVIEGVDIDQLIGRVSQYVLEKQERHLRKVINGTGIIVHTNLGRSNLSQKAIEAVVGAAGSYSNLEYNLVQGKRGSRYSHVTGLLCELLGCESALVVNNNAAAMLLVLSALGQGKEAIVSRGELVEIGGSFRIPDVMQQGGCVLREVGTTNRTHLQDYEHAINDQTALIVKVHTSNYRIVGFTTSVPLVDLKVLALKHNLPLIEDMGSGLLIDLSPYGLSDEPTVQQNLQAGVDVITFSGDKLLGGPQAGIIVGKQQYIDRMKQHPLTRALRIDKMTLAALEATLLYYRDEERAMMHIPTLHLIALTSAQLKAKAEKLAALLQEASISASVVEASSQVGGGALPTQELPTFCIALDIPGYSPNQIAALLRDGNPPIIGRILKDQYLLDVRTIEEDDFPLIVERAKNTT